MDDEEWSELISELHDLLEEMKDKGIEKSDIKMTVEEVYD
jgi:DNA-binding transcriptional regulator YhcF (GntR family)